MWYLYHLCDIYIIYVVYHYMIYIVTYEAYNDNAMKWFSDGIREQKTKDHK